jgi:hypothetical protein
MVDLFAVLLSRGRRQLRVKKGVLSCGRSS